MTFPILYGNIFLNWHHEEKKFTSSKKYWEVYVISAIIKIFCLRLQSITHVPGHKNFIGKYCNTDYTFSYIYRTNVIFIINRNIYEKRLTILLIRVKLPRLKQIVVFWQRQSQLWVSRPTVRREVYYPVRLGSLSHAHWPYSPGPGIAALGKQVTTNKTNLLPKKLLFYLIIRLINAIIVEMRWSGGIFVMQRFWNSRFVVSKNLYFSPRDKNNQSLSWL